MSASAAVQPAEILQWTVPGMLRARSALTPDEVAHWQLSPTGQWVSSTWDDYRGAVSALAAGFRRLGLARGDRVAIMAASCKEWDYAQLGLMAAGGIAVGLDPFAADDYIRDIARRCNFAAVVVDDPALLDKLGAEATRGLRFAVALQAAPAPGLVPLSSILAEAADDDDWNLAQADDAATMVFTSGTTGAPKGIEYSHRQMCLAANAILSAFPDIASGSRLACWLPLSNLFQRMINLCAVGRGAQTFFVADPREIMRFAPAIAPHIFIGVPRFYEKLYAGIQAAILAKPAWQRDLARWALDAGARHAEDVRAGRRSDIGTAVRFAVADRVVLRKLRGVIGANLRFMISGSAPMPVWLLERLHAMGLLVLEAYGLSENVIPVALNRPGCYRFGSVGQRLPGCELRLAADGELLVRGPGVSARYFGDCGEESGLDADGYLATGDFASVDADGFITLVGRKSEIFKTSTGRRIAPAGIEAQLRQIADVEHAVVFGAGRSHPVALIIVRPTAWSTDCLALCQRLREDVARAVAPLPPYLRPAGLAISAEALSIAGGELTPNLKLRRNNIGARYAPVLGELYARMDAASGSLFAVRSGDGLACLCNL
jgi:long-chain acyl-CoA synthetase